MTVAHESTTHGSGRHNRPQRIHAGYGPDKRVPTMDEAYETAYEEVNRVVLLHGDKLTGVALHHLDQLARHGLCYDTGAAQGTASDEGRCEDGSTEGTDEG